MTVTMLLYPRLTPRRVKPTTGFSGMLCALFFAPVLFLISGPARRRCLFAVVRVTAAAAISGDDEAVLGLFCQPSTSEVQS